MIDKMSESNQHKFEPCICATYKGGKRVQLCRHCHREDGPPNHPPIVEAGGED